MFKTVAPLTRAPEMGAEYPGSALAEVPVGTPVEVDAAYLIGGSGEALMPDHEGEVLLVRPAYGFVDARTIARA